MPLFVCLFSSCCGRTNAVRWADPIDPWSAANDVIDDPTTTNESSEERGCAAPGDQTKARAGNERNEKNKQKTTKTKEQKKKFDGQTESSCRCCGSRGVGGGSAGSSGGGYVVVGGFSGVVAPHWPLSLANPKWSRPLRLAAAAAAAWWTWWWAWWWAW